MARQASSPLVAQQAALTLPLALTRTLALALTLTLNLTLILSPQDAYPYLLRMPYPTPYPYLLRMPYPAPYPYLLRILFLRGEEERGRQVAAARRADADDRGPRRGGQGADAGREGEVMGTVHRAGCDCRELHAALVRGCELVRSAPQLAAALEADEGVDTSGRRVGSEASVVIFCRDRRGMLVDLSTVVTAVAWNILDVASETRAGGGEAAFQYTVQLEDKVRLGQMILGPAPDPDPSLNPKSLPLAPALPLSRRISSR